MPSERIEKSMSVIAGEITVAWVIHRLSKWPAPSGTDMERMAELTANATNIFFDKVYKQVAASTK